MKPLSRHLRLVKLPGFFFGFDEAFTKVAGAVKGVVGNMNSLAAANPEDFLYRLEDSRLTRPPARRLRARFLRLTTLLSMSRLQPSSKVEAAKALIGAPERACRATLKLKQQKD